MTPLQTTIRSRRAQEIIAATTQDLRSELEAKDQAIAAKDQIISELEAKIAELEGQKPAPKAPKAPKAAPAAEPVAEGEAA